MEICLYRDERICAYDIRLPNDVLNWDLRKNWRKAAQLDNLKCECCNQEVELRAGQKKIPYFIHKRGSLVNCSIDIEYRSKSEEHKQ